MATSLPGQPVTATSREIEARITADHARAEMFSALADFVTMLKDGVKPMLDFAISEMKRTSPR